ncbi:MAG: EAL domain-containing protein [Gammaproteobacteria bacterium]|nr:EAL domain-containing protein [Gammaproteobacteria bacterium]
MIRPRLSVRQRLLGLVLALLAIFAGISLLLGNLVIGNLNDQRAIQEQYRRFDVIQTVAQDLLVYRQEGGKWNLAMMREAPPAEVQRARAGLDRARHTLDEQLLRLKAFDPAVVRVVDAALQGLDVNAKSAVEATLQQDTKTLAALIRDIQARFDRISDSLGDAIARQQTVSDTILQRSAQRAETAVTEAGMAIALGSALGLMLLLMVLRSILRPLRTLTAAIRQVNAGQTVIDLPQVTADEFGETALALHQFRDHAEKLQRLAYEDPLTGLGNRARLEQRLRATIATHGDRRQCFALLYLDLDNFRAVNDRLGYRAGDRYLVEAVTRMRRFAPDDALLCRFSGDKFVAVVEELPPAAAEHLQRIADAVLRGLAEPYPVGAELLNMSVSIGVALYPDDGGSVEQLISSAEAAVYAAKQSGRNNVRFASGSLTAALRQELALAGEIRAGLQRGEFEPFYQPIVDVAVHRVAGAEALLRWRHPQRGLLLPDAFIAAAENQGLIAELGEHILRSAHAQVRRWRLLRRAWCVGVNLSARQLQQARILPPLQELQRQDAAASAALDLELTESVLFDSSEVTRRTLEAIKRLGYRLGIDDFGTGYSSFSMLQQFPIDKIKIDRQFVVTMERSRAAQAIVSAMLTLAASLGLEVVAEGVETSAQSLRLQTQGCRLQQGFFFSRAMPAGEFERWTAVFEGGSEPVDDA